MGIGQKIKEALAVDHEPGHGSSHDAPGAYPGDDPTGTNVKHSDGREYIPPHGTAVDDSSVQAPGSAVHPAVGRAGDQLHGRREYDNEPGYAPGRDAYGDGRQQQHARFGGGGGASHEGHGFGHEHGHRHGDSGVDIDPAAQGRHHERVGKEPYWGDVEGRGHHHGAGRAGAGPGLGAEKELPNRPHHGHGTAGEAGLPPPSGPAVGGGVYNTVTGTGSNEGRGRHGMSQATAGTGHSAGPGESRLMGNEPMGGAYDSRTGAGRDERSGLGPAGTAAAAGAGMAAGEAAHERHGHHGIGHHKTGHEHAAVNPAGSNHPGAGGAHGREPPLGAARSNMLEESMPASRDPNVMPPIPVRGPANATLGGGPAVGPHGEAPPSSGPGMGAGSGGLAGAGAVGASRGQEHFGPGHEGARVVHKCHNCGVDNDISHYFKKDAVYRIGS